MGIFRKNLELEKEETENLKNEYNTKHETFILDNGYIKVYIVENIKYEIINKKDSDGANILTSDELKKYNIKINEENSFARIIDIGYSFRFNDYYFRGIFSKIDLGLIDPIDNIVCFSVGDYDGRYSSNYVEIEEFLVKVAGRPVYCVSCNINQKGLDSLKKEAKVITNLYMRNKLINDSDSISSALDYYIQYKNQYKSIINYEYEKNKSFSIQAKENVEKVRKYVKNYE